MKDNVNLDNEKVYNSRFKMKLNRRDLRGMIFSAFLELSAAYDLKELYKRMNRVSNFSRFRKRVLYALSKDVQYSLSSSLSSDSISGKKRGPYNKIHD